MDTDENSALSKEEIELRTYVSRRERMFRRLQVTYDLMANLPADQEVFLARAEKIDEHYETFEQLQDHVARLNAIVPPRSQVTGEAVSHSYEELHYRIRGKARTLLKGQSASNEDTRVSHESRTVRPKLPPINIPKFRGDFEEFPTFKGLFDTLVHDTDLPDIQKFSFLLSYLEQPALGVVDHLKLTGENYMLAYTNLVARYTDRRLVGNHFLNKILQFRPSASGSAQRVRQFLDEFCGYYDSLKSLEIGDLSEFIVVQIALRVIDTDIKRLFEAKFSDKEFPSFDDLVSFMRDQHKVIALIHAPPVKSGNPDHSNRSTNQSYTSKKSNRAKSTATSSFVSRFQDHESASSITRALGTNQTSVLPCPICKKGHKIYGCADFLAMNTDRRFDVVKSLKLCFGCLGHHARSQCSSKLSCRTCHMKSHHTLLHRGGVVAPSNPGVLPVVPEGNSGNPDNRVVPITNALNSQTSNLFSNPVVHRSLIGTAKAHVLSANGDWVPCRILIDPASESSFISESLAQSLKLRRINFPVQIVGIGSSSFPNNRGKVLCKIRPIFQTSPTVDVEAIVLKSIATDTPRVPISPEVRSKFENLDLADSDFDNPGPVDLLLGVQHYSDILPDDMTLVRGEPSALKTIFGFVLFGKIPDVDLAHVSHSYCSQSPSLDEFLRKFWETEEVQVRPVVDSEAEAQCERYFKETTTRDHQGRYQVSIPFRDLNDVRNLGSTRDIAHKRLLGLERRLLRRPVLYEQYVGNLGDYVKQDHMRVAKTKVDYVLTHHVVVKDSSSTQVRVVFNGSEKSTTSHSLNEFLLAGPKLQSDISDILLNFRLYSVALTADIRQMFRCIRLHEYDRQFTHLVWRADTLSPITEWELTTLPFGLTCSPFIAQRVVQQLVQDEGHDFPLATQLVRSRIYVDDFVSSVREDDVAISLFHQLKSMFARGGFELRKFASNSTRVLAEIPSELQVSAVSFDQSEGLKLLGLMWDPVSDTFGYRWSSDQLRCTKRGILSQVARIYDIQGFLSPVTFWIKAFIQGLWLSRVGWDEEIPLPLQQDWIKFHSELPEIQRIRVPRHVLIDVSLSCALVGFCDASEKGFAACVYVRVELQDQTAQTYLLKAKSRVAPLKTLTIPRLELGGALLLAQLIDSMKEFRSILPDHQLFGFTDSTVVLSWIQTPVHMLKTYVAHRVGQITEIIAPELWWHVAGMDNAADIASRGSYPSQLCDNELWWAGPTYLRTPIAEWVLFRPPIKDPVPELRTVVNSLVSKVSYDSDHFVEGLLARVSSLARLTNIVGYVLRFVTNLRAPKSKCRVGILSVRESSDSLHQIVKWTQEKYFPDIIDNLRQDRAIRGYVKYVTPFLSSDGLLRVGGRLSLSPLSDKSKHPLLIPRKSPLALLLCSHYHRITLHGGPQLVQSLVQREYWIIGIRSLLRSVIFRCVTCYKFKAKPLEPLMSQIPGSRFQRSRAFVDTGVDLAGPYLVKESRRRNARCQKGWLVLFTCLTTRAVHLDIVSDISTPTFLAALDRFVGRRGIPSRIYSDLGTNFVGAARHLKEVYAVLKRNDEEIQAYCVSREIEWKFNPPASPNFGGCWEAAIKLMKHHLRRVIADRPLTYEEYSTMLVRIEAILNSRPLCPLSSSPEDGFDYLTPGHFLVGAPLIMSRPERELSGEAINFNSRWELISRSVQDIWKRWTREYLHTLMQRSKWCSKSTTLKPGQLVLLTDNTALPTSWKLARVLQVFPGRDGVIRVVRLRTPTGELTRPVNKLCHLPFDS